MTTVKNPRHNAILERAHAVINNHLRFLRTLDPNQTMQDSDPWETFLCLLPLPLIAQFMLQLK